MTRGTRAPRWVIALACLVIGAHAASAQDTGPGLRPNHLTLAGGLIISGGYSVGDRNAEIRRNATGPATPFTLFRAESSLRRTTGVEARIGLALTRALGVEVGGTYMKPQLAVTISQDNEAEGTSLVAEEMSQYTVEVSGVFQLPRITLGSRLRPYAAAGAGYLRQLHQDRLLVETGRTYHVGAGVHYWLRGGSAKTRPLGVRADTRFVHRTGGVDFEDKSRNYPVFSLLGFAGF